MHHKKAFLESSSFVFYHKRLHVTPRWGGYTSLQSSLTPIPQLKCWSSTATFIMLFLLLNASTSTLRKMHRTKTVCHWRRGTTSWGTAPRQGSQINSISWLNASIKHSYHYLQLLLSLSVCCSPSPRPPLSPLSILMAVFPGEPGLAGFIEAEDDGGDGDNWSYKTCKAPVKFSWPTNQHPMLYRPDAHPVAKQQCWSTEDCYFGLYLTGHFCPRQPRLDPWSPTVIHPKKNPSWGLQVCKFL